MGDFRYTVPKPVATSLPSALYELFDNTHRWGRQDWRKQPVSPSLRGVLVQTHHAEKYSADSLLERATGAVPIENYLRRLIDSRQMFDGLVELSIFDSGVGLAPQMARSEISGLSLQAEYDLIMRCLRQWGTSSQDLNRGLGLHRMMLDVSSAGGFVRLRTGRLALYRDFIDRPYRGFDPANPQCISFADWANNDVSPTRMPMSAGALFTVMVPLVRNERR